MYQYAQINEEGTVIGISFLTEKDKRENMLYLGDNQIGITSGWQWIDGAWHNPASN